MQTADRGRFITFEGVDGAGKSTQLDAIARALEQQGVPMVRTREPGGTPLGEALRGLMLGQAMVPMTETLLMFAARQEHMARIIRPALQNARWVLCDRFTDASYAYQGGGRGVAVERLDILAAWVQEELQPDLTVLVDIDPVEAERRRAQVRAADRFETESSAFFRAVRAAYLQRVAADRSRFLVVDGGAPPSQVTAAIWERLAPWLT